MNERTSSQVDIVVIWCGCWEVGLESDKHGFKHHEPIY